jgi:hypothetical protein
MNISFSVLNIIFLTNYLDKGSCGETFRTKHQQDCIHFAAVLDPEHIFSDISMFLKTQHHFTHWIIWPSGSQKISLLNQKPCHRICQTQHQKKCQPTPLSFLSFHYDNIQVLLCGLSWQTKENLYQIVTNTENEDQPENRTQGKKPVVWEQCMISVNNLCKWNHKSIDKHCLHHIWVPNTN